MKGQGKAGAAMSEYRLHRPRREAGQGRQALEVHQPVRLRDRRQHQDRRICRDPEERQIGSNCKISSHTFVCEGVTIEDNVFIGHGVTFINDIYPRATTADGGLQTEADWKVEPTLIRSGASIGPGATILANVTVGENAIVGAGSVVTKNVPAEYDRRGKPGTGDAKHSQACAVRAGRSAGVAFVTGWCHGPVRASTAGYRSRLL